ncbi:acyltransferase family protein [Nocardioides pocheonensis]|uniref:acyltransferase family protein n=1 Tax=Nocardioides pocheonensis TaxID=661485 RepID=UPI00161273DB|nr:acyltransferase [Nocardioides pocheonensis]
MAKSAVIAPLTGVRLVAAVWVVLFHIYLYNGDDLSARHPAVDAVVGPIVSQGDLGVDLFFLLSGFVLAHNYLERLGEGPSLSGAVSFLWLRVARVWPLYMVAIVGGGLLLSLRFWLWGSQPNVPLTVPHFVAQVFMVQQWGAANVPNTSWTGPAWSISAEWLAYLCFPVLAIAVWRLRRYAGPRTLVALGGMVLLPTLVWTAVAQTQAAPYMWLVRLASEFTCGALLSAATRHELPRLTRASGWLAPAAIALGAAWLYVAGLTGRSWLGPLVLAVFPILLLGLAHGDSPVHRWLGSRPMVLGGGVSFALYLVHVPLLKLFRDALDHDALPISPRNQLYGELAIAALSLLIAWALFRHVEEPARHRLRAVGPRVAELPAAVRRIRLPESSRIVRVAPATEHVVQQQAVRSIC